MGRRINTRVRLTSKNDQFKQEADLLREELHVKDARTARVHLRHRPNYRPTDRMAILQIKAVRGWNTVQAPRHFLIEPATVASWLKRIAIVIDHFSQRPVGVAVFRKQPTSVQGRTFLGRLYAKAKPKYIVYDKGKQFWCDGFKAWCRRTVIKPRFGAVGRYGGIAVLKRFIRTLKEECTRRIAVPLRGDDMRRELVYHLDWYNKHRPHEYFEGRTPNETYHDRPAADETPRIEPRSKWPPGARCAAPAAAIDGKPGQKVVPVVSYHAGRKHLPVIQLKGVA